MIYDPQHDHKSTALIFSLNEDGSLWAFLFSASVANIYEVFINEVFFILINIIHIIEAKFPVYSRRVFPYTVPYFQLHEIDNVGEWLQIPRKIINDWIEYNLIEDGDNDFKWYDMSTGLRAILIAIVLQNESQDQVDEELFRKFVYAADVHVQVLSVPELLNPGNHGLSQVVGLASLCKTLPGFVNQL